MNEAEDHSYWDAGNGIEVTLDTAGFWTEVRYMVSWPLTVIKKGFLLGEPRMRQLARNRSTDPLIANAPYKLVVRDSEKGVVLYEQKGFKGEQTRRVGMEWAGEIRRIGVEEWLETKTCDLPPEGPAAE